MDWTNKLKNNYVRWAISSETNEIHDDTDFDLFGEPREVHRRLGVRPLGVRRIVSLYAHVLLRQRYAPSV